MMVMMGIDDDVLPDLSKSVSFCSDSSLASACFIPINPHHHHHFGAVELALVARRRAKVLKQCH
jgi:hypothetical protein